MRLYFPNLSPVRGFRHLAAGIAVFAVASGPAFADLIVLRDGHEYEGTLVRATKDSVVFRRGDRTVTYPRSEVVHIRLQKKRKWAGARRAADIPDEEFQTALAENERIDPRKWPGAGVVTLLRKLTVEVRTPQTWVLRSRRIVRILNEHGESASVQQMVYRGDVDRVRILYGITVRPDGAVLHLADTAVQDESVYPEYPRYDTVRRRRFALPEGKPGNVLASEVEIERVRPMKLMYFAREFLFGGRDPVVRAEVEISAPPDVPFHWTVLNDPEGTVRHTVERRKGRVVHRWVRLHSPQMLPEPLMPPWSDVVPRLVASAGTTSWAEAAARFRAELQRLDQTYTRPFRRCRATMSAPYGRRSHGR